MILEEVDIMRLLYIAPPIIDIKMMDGVAKKIMSQVKAFSKEYDVLLLFRDNENVQLLYENEKKTIKMGEGKSKFDIIKVAFHLLKRESIDFCYIRYPNSDPIFLSLLKQMQKKGMSVVIEIPTYPYDEEGKESVKGRMINKIDKFYRKKLCKHVNRIVTYSDDDEIFGVKTIRTVNGLDFENVDLSDCIFEGKTIHLCGVAAINRNNGYDRLIEGIKNYYDNGGDREIIFDVVGYGEDYILNHYKNLVNDYKLENRVVFHGRLHGKSLNDIYSTATIGINSLAIHRQNLKKESTLKTREYAAKGLPILSSSVVDAFDDIGNSKYVYMVSADDSPIDIVSVCKFIDDLYSVEDVNSIKRNIRKNAKAICDMIVTLVPIVNYFNSTNNSKNNMM